MNGVGSARGDSAQQERNSPPSSRTSQWIALGAILLLGTALRFHNLGAKSLWGDEAYQATWARQSLAWIYHLLLPSAEAALDIYITHFLRLLGEQEFILRFGAAFWGVLALPLIYRLGRRFSQPATGFLAALFLAISPVHVAYSQELHTYALLILLTILSADRFAAAMRRTSWRTCVAWLMVTLLGLYAHLFFAFVLASEVSTLVIVMVWRRKRASLRQLALLFLTAALIVLLWLPEIVPAISDVLGRLGQEPAQASVAVGTAWLPRVLAALWALIRDLALFLAGSAGSAVALCTLLIVGAVAAWLGLIGPRPALKPKKGSPEGTSLVLSLLLLVLPLATVLWHTIPEARYLRYYILVLPALLVLAAHGVVAIGQVAGRAVDSHIAQRLAQGRRVRASLPAQRAWRPSGGSLVGGVLILAMTVSISALSIGPLRAYYVKPKDDWRDAAAFLERSHQANDAIACLRWAAMAIRYYTPGLPVEKLAQEDTAELERLLEQHPRIWYVRSASQTNLKPDLEAWIRQRDDVTLQVPGVLLTVASRDGPLANAERQQLLEQMAAWFPSAPSLIQLGDLYAQQGQAEQALREYLRAVELAPRSGWAQTRLGNEYRVLGQQAQAEAAYRRAIEVEPDYTGAYMGLANIQLAQGHPDEALATCQEGVRRAPHSAWAHSMLGEVYLQMGDAENALAHLRQAVDLEPENVTWLLALANGCRRLGQTEEAVSLYRQVLVLQPGNQPATEALKALAP